MSGWTIPGAWHVLAIVGLLSLLSLSCPAQWSRRGSTRSDEPELLTSIAYGQGKYVAVGNDLTILLSKDNVTWTRGGAQVLSHEIGVNYSWETFSAGGDAVTFFYPDVTNGVRMLPRLHMELRAVTFGGGTFVIVGDSGWILTSRTGENWTIRHSGTTEDLTAICWGTDRFVAVGKGSTILQSREGSVWTRMESPTKKTLRSVAYGNNVFLAVGDDDSAIFVSSDGVTWRAQPTEWGSPLASVAFGGGRFMIIGPAGVGLSAVSEDGRGWRSAPNPSSSKVQLSYAAGHFVCTTTSGRPLILGSDDRWRADNPSISAAFYNGMDTVLSVTEGPGGVLVSAGSRIEASYDGVCWYQRVTPWSKLIWGFLYKDGDFTPAFPFSEKGTFPEFHIVNHVMKSTDGVIWKGRGTGPMRGFVNGNERAYVLKQADREAAAFTSEDGINWTRLKAVASSRTQSVAAGLPTEPNPVGTTLSNTNQLAMVYINGKGYRLELPNFSGAVWYLQASTDLVHWVETAIWTNTTGRFTFEDPEYAKYPQRFYRLMLQ